MSLWVVAERRAFGIQAKRVGSLMGIAVVGGGYLAVKSSGVMLDLSSVIVSGEAWVIVGAIIFFLVTNKQHTVT